MVMLSVKIFVFIVMLVHYSLQVFKYGPKIVLLTAQVSVETPSWPEPQRRDRKSTRLNSSHGYISYAVFCLKKKTRTIEHSKFATTHPVSEMTRTLPIQSTSPAMDLTHDQHPVICLTASPDPDRRLRRRRSL